LFHAPGARRTLLRSSAGEQQRSKVGREASGPGHALCPELEALNFSRGRLGELGHKPHAPVHLEFRSLRARKLNSSSVSSFSAAGSHASCGTTYPDGLTRPSTSWPATAHSLTAGCSISVYSTSMGETHRPLTLSMSFPPAWYVNTRSRCCTYLRFWTSRPQASFARSLPAYSSSLV
jgi:hypothetical protein